MPVATRSNFTTSTSLGGFPWAQFPKADTRAPNSEYQSSHCLTGVLALRLTPGTTTRRHVDTALQSSARGIYLPCLGFQAFNFCYSRLDSHI